MSQEHKTNKQIILKRVSSMLEVMLMVLGIVAFYVMLVLISFSPFDPSWSQTAVHGSIIHNLGGGVGAWLADTLFFIFGVVSYVIAPIMLFFCWDICTQINKYDYIDLFSLSLRLIGSLALLLTSCTLAALHMDDFYYFVAGGIIGSLLSKAILLEFCNSISIVTPALLGVWAVGFSLFTGWLLLLTIVKKIGTILIHMLTFIYSGMNRRHYNNNNRLLRLYVAQENNTHPVLCSFSNMLPQVNEEPHDRFKLPSIPVIETQQQILVVADDGGPPPYMGEMKENMRLTLSHQKPVCIPKKEQQLQKSSTPPLPSMDLLISPPYKEDLVDLCALEQTHMARLVETKLADYRIKAKVVSISSGPVITRFELYLAPGVKAARISSLSRDLARSLSVITVRVVEVIPGKPYVGLELPNKCRQTVYLREVLDCETFRNTSSPLALVLGKDIGGQPVIADLSKMPHVLIAGTTGSGKSVGVNAMILSILYKATPQEVRFIMIDPKMLELSLYKGIPHLLIEVVTDMKDATNALRWCVNEMERRYKLMAALGVRNLTVYNERIKQTYTMGRQLPELFYNLLKNIDDGSIAQTAPVLEKLPYIVVMVDEFADLMISVGKQAEELIGRLAQKARAAGIHLVLATQRPSVDVITGLIKANIPTRIAFTVSSKIDSRTILDQTGAESLLGMGDMLYLESNSSLPVRVHGAFIRDEEVYAVVNDWKNRGQPPQYIDNLTSSC